MNDLDSSQRLLRPLTRYYHECLAAQSEWARAVNVAEQKDVFLVPLAAAQQIKFGRTGSLLLCHEEALELGSRYVMGGSAVSLLLGALFLVGRLPASGDKGERRFCAPLLEAPLTLRRELSDMQIVIEPEESVFSVNYSLLGALLEDEEERQDQLADLVELAPDFPIDASEFDEFWNGFCAVARHLPLSTQLPDQRRGGKTARATPMGADPNEEMEERGDTLDLIDYYDPVIPEDEQYRLMPAAALILGKRPGHSLTALLELQEMADQPLERTAIRNVFDPQPTWSAAGQPAAEDAADDQPAENEPEDIFPMSLTLTQQEVVRKARSAPLTVVTGPPGTGKSYTITAIVLEALLGGQSVLVASQMDKAVQVVAEQVQQLAGPYAIARSGGRAAQRELASKISQLTGPRSSLAGSTPESLAQQRAQHAELSRQLEGLSRRFREICQDELTWSKCSSAARRLQQICPLPVQEVTPEQFRQAAAKATKAERSSRGHPGWLRRWWAGWNARSALRLLDVPGHWNGSLPELGELLRAQEMRLQAEQAAARLPSPLPANSLWTELQQLEGEVRRTALQLLRKTRDARLSQLIGDQRQRQQLRHLGALLRRRQRKLKQELREKIDPAVLLAAFPAWACTLRTLGDILPPTPGLFDLVVIDEASQCDPALACLALLRGKRAVIVGDPHQLRHVCFLSRAREQASFVRCGLSPQQQELFRYRRSIFDIAADTTPQDQFFLLDQHFRSAPHIIHFSNQRFYGGRLRIMTQRPWPASSQAITVRHLPHGRREPESSVNLPEVEAVCEEIAGVVERARHSGCPPSIGIVSPFRDHVDAIGERIVDQLSGADIQRHDIVVGTAHSLQGDEKDIVIMATSIDEQSHPASLRFLQNPNLFNVAVTRARREMRIITSTDPQQLPPGLLRDYLQHAEQPVAVRHVVEYDNPFEERVAAALRKQNLDVLPNFFSAGVRIDLVVGRNGSHLALLCDVHPPHADELDPLRTHRILARAGWRVQRLPHRAWEADWEACHRAISEAL